MRSFVERIHKMADAEYNRGYDKGFLMIRDECQTTLEYLAGQEAEEVKEAAIVRLAVQTWVQANIPPNEWRDRMLQLEEAGILKVNAALKAALDELQKTEPDPNPLVSFVQERDRV